MEVKTAEVPFEEGELQEMFGCLCHSTEGGDGCCIEYQSNSIEDGFLMCNHVSFAVVLLLFKRALLQKKDSLAQRRSSSWRQHKESSSGECSPESGVPRDFFFFFFSGPRG